ncbi:helix-turn-helix transcriptional regulator [Bradyrhizobium diazoefficiens]|uniref:helix-turn-helix transcriptional regulator n=1 Tax=Bradyrhizobium diazoefficiens TaxID=1355477 RepID=UPI0027153029|nr:helix-turn-helix transcriptional regulator [Bradyrhizobium diazoefficiens]WLB37997.1 helix-turn-helix transcriptional regulator [Bradyrhizobium diazoefficiens]WLC17118.1 helix-turn-helix transcriptional regulator [Bradyrhizobium diazoefficiens]
MKGLPTLKKPTKTAAKRKARPRRRPGAAIGAEPQVEGGKTNKPFAERFQEGRLSTAEILGENVKRLRTGLKLSQADLARAIRTDQSAIGLIEIKRANPTLRTMEKLAAVLKTTVVDLLSKPGRRRPR